eukprot:CAMPEP_0119328104 /NCGR_PEP_ID=MMETSP1333-20130426/72463_1 /TAXON_ID=418940 /ORGANISM="Scyphosphaera apsteinii, Strain RCC1455" /LENGTH=439 /DNA_ID=CAMNT_0007336867 /DNA_START=173 /DNA_END=1494 /DNA_ORIENTATION=+
MARYGHLLPSLLASNVLSHVVKMFTDVESMLSKALVDKHFPASDSSIGWLAKPGMRVQWLRGAALVQKGSAEQQEKCVLIRDGITPQDVAQGALGDCWLLAAAVCLAEFPDALRNLFVTREANDSGSYSVRLWDDRGNGWQTVTISDEFPCDEHGKPLFAQTASHELWVLVLEKAFAKFCHGYHHLDGGLTLWALHVMTGDHVFNVKRQADDRWKRFDLVSYATADKPSQCGLRSTQEDHELEALWLLLLGYDRSNAVMGASISNDGEKQRDDGLVAGHAYALLECREIFGFRLLKIRNPWGCFEWTGPWSDSSAEWTDNPAVTRAIGKKLETNSPDDDGCFWMPFDHFVAIFDSIAICDRSTGLQDMVLDVDEDAGVCGPAMACLKVAVPFGSSVKAAVRSTALMRAHAKPGGSLSIAADASNVVSASQSYCERQLYA